MNAIQTNEKPSARVSMMGFPCHRFLLRLAARTANPCFIPLSGKRSSFIKVHGNNLNGRNHVGFVAQSHRVYVITRVVGPLYNK